MRFVTEITFVSSVQIPMVLHLESSVILVMNSLSLTLTIVNQVKRLWVRLAKSYQSVEIIYRTRRVW
mgnify:FL=1